MINQQLVDDCIKFLQRLIQTPSMPKQEGAIARIVAKECGEVGFDSVRIDRAGNVLGILYGEDRSLPPLVLATHLDHVDPGDLSLWTTGPFEAAIVDGRVIGRGSSDIKGPLATHVYAAAALVRAGIRPKRNIFFTAAVEEETGGAGAIHWASRVDYPISLIVIGEPSANDVAVGHRGVEHLWVTYRGRSAHASVPHMADNPAFALGQFITRFEAALASIDEQMVPHPRLGATTIAPTIVEVDTESANVTPAWARVCLDIRTATESLASVTAWLNDVVGLESAECTAVADQAPDPARDQSEAVISGFDTDPHDPDVQIALALISKGMQRQPILKPYGFATDGRHMTHLGAPIIGYAPGDENVAHTANESISIAQMEEGLRGTIELIKSY